jgi:coenzyme F420-0:L-glutamate ligase / coenzyme F420-1:gamma-L-glutamate ligase
MSGHEPTAWAELLSLLRARRSVRRFRAQPVPDSLLEQLFEAARWAPSAGNRQSFRLLVVRAPARIAELGAIVRAECQAVLAAARPQQSAGLIDYLRNFHLFDQAPVLVAVIYRSGGPALLEGAPNRSGIDALAGATAAIMNLLLAAHALGLGSCWMTGPLLVAEAKLAELLQVPAGWSLAALVPVGYPDEAPAAPPRRPLSELVHYLDEEVS